MFPLSCGGTSPVLLGLGLPIRIGSGMTPGLYDCAASKISDQSVISRLTVSERGKAPC